MYVMKTCPYCAHVMKQVVGIPHFKVIDIGEDVQYQQLKMRRQSRAFHQEAS